MELNILTNLAKNAESESVSLGATRDLLDRAGFRPVDRHEIVNIFEVSLDRLFCCKSLQGKHLAY